MEMKRVLGMAILIVGVVLLVFGINATHSVNEQVVQAVKGTYTDTTIWYIIGGILLIAIGAGFALLRRGR